MESDRELVLRFTQDEAEEFFNLIENVRDFLEGYFEPQMSEFVGRFKGELSAQGFVLSKEK